MMKHPDAGRKFQAFGPANEYGDTLPGGSEFIDFIYRSHTMEHHFVLAADESRKLRDELVRACGEIDASAARAGIKE